MGRLLNWRPDETEGRRIQELLPELNWEELKSSITDEASAPRGTNLRVAYPRVPRFFCAFTLCRWILSPSGGSGMALILNDATEARQRTFEAIESERIHSLTLAGGQRWPTKSATPSTALHIHLQLMDRQIKKLGSPGVAAAAGRFLRRDAKLEAGTAEVAEKLEQYLEVAKGEISRLDYIVTPDSCRPSARRHRN